MRAAEEDRVDHICEALTPCVRIKGLTARPELNGAHVVRLKPTTPEAAELSCKGRAKVRVASTLEVLSLKLEALEVLEAPLGTYYSTAELVVAPVAGCGYGLLTQRSIRQEQKIFCEPPLIAARCLPQDALRIAPELEPLFAKLAPLAAASAAKGGGVMPAEAIQIMTTMSDRVVANTFAQCSKRIQRRAMALSDAFAESDAAKTAVGVFRSNAFGTKDGLLGANLYELLSRANHSCRPNIRVLWDGDEAVVVALRDIARGEELRVAYKPAAGFTTQERRERLQMHYNFVCRCDLCGSL